MVFAQYIITGKVLNTADNRPLESATVFVNKTNCAAKTDQYGNFRIQNVQRNHFELIVSMIGFKTHITTFAVQADIKLAMIGIEEKTNILNEVKITNAKKLGIKYMSMFEREILGTSKFGQQCRILNPEVVHLNFDRAENKLTAYTSDFMLIENIALGYRLKYLIEDFERNEKTELISYVDTSYSKQCREMIGNAVTGMKNDWKYIRVPCSTFFDRFLATILTKMKKLVFC